MAFKQVEKGFPLDELQQHMRDGRLYKKVDLGGGATMYEQLLAWAGIARLYRNEDLFLEVRGDA